MKNGPRFSDRRSLLRTTLAFVPAGTPWRLALDFHHGSRAGSAGAVEEARSESSAGASLGVEF